MASGERRTRGKRRDELRPRPRGERGGCDSATNLEQVQRPRPPQARPQRQAGRARGPSWFRTRTGVGERERHLHTPTPEVAATQGGQWRKAAGGEETVLTRGGQAGAGPRPGSSMAAALRPPRLRTPGAPAAARRVDEGAVSGEAGARGSLGAPDLSCSAAGARPPEPQPQREPGSGQEAGARRWQRLRGRRPRRRQPGPAWPQPPPTPAGPADGQSEAPGAGARAEAGRGAQRGARPEGRRALAPAPGHWVPAGPVPRKLPGRAGGTRREGRGAWGGGGAGAARARGGDPRPFSGSSWRRSAVLGPRPGSP